MKQALVTIATTVEELEALPDEQLIITLPYPMMWYKVRENHWSNDVDWQRSEDCIPAIIVDGGAFGDVGESIKSVDTLRGSDTRVRAMLDEMGDAIGFDRMVHGRESEYPVSHFRDKLEEALDND